MNSSIWWIRFFITQARMELIKPILNEHPKYEFRSTNRLACTFYREFSVADFDPAQLKVLAEVNFSEPGDRSPAHGRFRI